MFLPCRYTFTGCTAAVEDPYGVLAPTCLKFVLDHPCLRVIRSNPEKQSIAVTQKTVLCGRACLGGFTGFGGQFAHGGGCLGGILGGTLGGICAGWVGLCRIVAS